MRFGMARLMAASACAVMALAIATPSSAQVSTGRIDAAVADSTGAVLPGVTVDISGPQNQTAVTDTQGEAHFLNLAPGTYTVSAKLTGFGDYLNKNVAVATGGERAAARSRCRSPASRRRCRSRRHARRRHEEDGARRPTSASRSCRTFPSSRDPWVVLQTVPGVIVDRVNVGGAESGQQSTYQAKGATGAENTWNMDGIAITDMAATGSTPTYYDFDMFQEMQVTTGGADVHEPDAGRAAEHGAQERQQHAARQHAHLLRERGHAVEQPVVTSSRPPSAARRARATAWTSTRTTASSSAARS